MSASKVMKQLYWEEMSIKFPFKVGWKLEIVIKWVAKNKPCQLAKTSHTRQIHTTFLHISTKNKVISTEVPGLTPNMPLIHNFFTYSKLNMDKICGLKSHLVYVHTSQIFLSKSLLAQMVSFLLLNLHFWAQIYLSMK